MYKIIFTEQAVCDIEDLDTNIRKRIASKLKKFARAPFTYAKKLTRHEIGSYRFRIGDYRAIFDVDGDKIVILRIGHRDKIYK